MSKNIRKRCEFVKVKTGTVSQWPFEVCLDKDIKGIRGLSDLEKNLTNVEKRRILNYYSNLREYFLENPNISHNLTHLLISSNRVYFDYMGNKNKSCMKSLDIDLNIDHIYFSILYDNKYFTKKIEYYTILYKYIYTFLNKSKKLKYFDLVNKSNEILIISKRLQDSIKSSVEVYNNRVNLEDFKPLYNIFNSGILFPSLKYVIIDLTNKDVIYDNMKKKVLEIKKNEIIQLDNIYSDIGPDFSYILDSVVMHKMQNLKEELINILNISLEQLIEYMYSDNIQCLKSENIYKNMVSSTYKNLQLVYYLNDLSNVDQCIIDNIFNKLSNLDTHLLNNLKKEKRILFESSIVLKRLYEREKEKEEIKEKQRLFLKYFVDIFDMLACMGRIYTVGCRCDNVAIEAEKFIWTKYFVKNKIKEGIQNEFDFNKDLFSNFSCSFSLTALKKYTFGSLGISDLDYLYQDNKNIIYQKLKNYISNQKEFDSVISLFNFIAPNYLKDERRTESSMGLSFNSKEESEKSVKIVESIFYSVLDVFEVFLGVQYGIFGKYMTHFDTWGLDLSIDLVPSISDSENPLICSKNILDIAERFFYTTLGLSLNKYSDKYYKSDYGISVLSPYSSFVKRSLDKVNDRSQSITEMLTHNTQIERYQNILRISKCIEFLCKQYLIFFKLSM